MTRDQISELQRLATEFQRLLDQGRAPTLLVPRREFRQLCRLATMAANTMELLMDSGRRFK